MREKMEQKFVDPVFYWILVVNFPGEEWQDLVNSAVAGAAEESVENVVEGFRQNGVG
jgi:hypothetical protein